MLVLTMAVHIPMVRMLRRQRLWLDRGSARAFAGRPRMSLLVIAANCSLKPVSRVAALQEARQVEANVQRA